MQRYATWHIWLGWLIAIPFLLWTISGVLMVARPIEEVRGTHLRIEPEQKPALTGNPRPIPFPEAAAPPISELRTFLQRGRAVTLATATDGSISRYDATTGESIGQLDEEEARAAIARSIRGGDRIAAMRAFEPDETPFDFRRPSPVWQATLEDGTYVYINRDSGEIEAVRTRWWRFYDLMWGLHIMDLQTREQPHNPLTVTFGVLAIFGSVLGTILLFRRRRARVSAPPAGG
ncbi:PepSY domain-containing protein [Tsuneonella sp. SYSU-LHT278]